MDCNWRTGLAPRGAGVYRFLIGTEVVYVGESVDLRDRIAQHFMSPWYRLARETSAPFVQWSLEWDRKKVEKRLIRECKPRLNAKQAGRKKRAKDPITEEQRLARLERRQRAKEKWRIPFTRSR